MGAAWKGVPSGRQGMIGCYSMQTYKHINSGEGGFLISDDAEVMARAVLLSGSYMLYGAHRAAPPAEVFERCGWRCPTSRAGWTICAPRSCARSCSCWPSGWRGGKNAIARLETGLRGVTGLRLVERPAAGKLCRFVLPVSAAGLVSQRGLAPF